MPTVINQTISIGKKNSLEKCHSNSIFFYFILSNGRSNCLFVVDAVATLGAADLYVDEYKIDACFGASQKVIGGPAGLAPVTFNSRALDAIAKRKKPSYVFYYDATYLSEFFKCTDKPRL